MSVNASKKRKDQPQKLNHLQSSMGIQGPSGKPGKGTQNQTLGESLRIGTSTGRRATKIGRNHLRESMGL